MIISFSKNAKSIQKRFLNLFRTTPNINLCDDTPFLTYVYKKKIGFESNLNYISTLALRASTIDYGFYPAIWKGSFNLGITSSDLFNTYHLYKNYRYQLSTLKNVIVSFSVPAPGFSLIRTKERYRTVAYKYFFNIPYSEENLIDPKLEKGIFKKCEHLKAQKLKPDYMGYEEKSYFGIHITAAERSRPHIRENRREPDQMNWLKLLMEIVLSDNRRLVVVVPPFRSDYKKLLPNESEIFEKLFNLKAHGLEVISLFDSDKFNDSDFGDVDHLNEQGAIKMTSELYKIFKKRLWL